MSLTIDNIRHYFETHQRRLLKDQYLIPAAVLIPLFERNGELHVIFTKRTDDVEHHKGQVSFPGGTMEKTDANSFETALREAEEEIGIKKNVVEVIGAHDDFATPSGFLITPVVAFLSKVPSFSLNTAEVTEVFDVPLSFFLDSRNELVEQRVHDGKIIDIYRYHYGRFEIWGVTAAILRAFVQDFVLWANSKKTL